MVSRKLLYGRERAFKVLESGMRLALRFNPIPYNQRVAARITLARLYRWSTFRKALNTSLVQARGEAHNPKEREVLGKLIDYLHSKQRSPERLFRDSFFVTALFLGETDMEPDQKGVARAHRAVLVAVEGALAGT